jgi:hypothetical protein
VDDVNTGTLYQHTITLRRGQAIINSNDFTALITVRVAGALRAYRYCSIRLVKSDFFQQTYCTVRIRKWKGDKLEDGAVMVTLHVN